jgi:hypothetical protein
MQARLSSTDYPELARLRTREKTDSAIALLDAWAIVGDVLTFYQERIANEGYLRTATERRSILELARLVGYALRPGVASTVYLAYTIEQDSAPVTIPVGTRSNSIPGPGEQMQAFETADPVEARFEWNTLRPRLARPQTVDSITKEGLFLKGTSVNLNPNDPLLVDFGQGQGPQLMRIERVEVDTANEHTTAWLRGLAASSAARHAAESGGVQPPGVGVPTSESAAAISPHNPLLTITQGLSVAPSSTPASAQQLPRDVKQSFAAGSDTTPRLLIALQPAFTDALYTAWKSVPPRVETDITVYALRVSAAPFGHNSPLRFNGYVGNNFPDMEEWNIADPWNQPPTVPVIGEPVPTAAPPAGANVTPEHHEPGKLYLDNKYDIAPDSYIAIEKSGQTIIAQPSAGGIVQRSLAAYGLSGQTTLVNLPSTHQWIGDPATEPFTTVRTTRVYAHSEKLELAEAPVTDDVSGADIELGDLYNGLQPGRWLIITGERTDIKDSSSHPIKGVIAAELLMLAGVTQSIAQTAGGKDLPGDQVHTFIHVANSSPVPDGSGSVPGLAYAYKRDTVTIYGNVVRANNGETRQETLGGGDASQSMQRFELKQSPLTYVSAPTVSGVSSTLQVRVNDVLWHEVDSLAGLGPNDRDYITRTDDNAKTAVIFGTGTIGARLPTGQESVKAIYRQGIGAPGNVRAQQISLVATRPLGVKAVINPMLATGGADAETRDQARGTVPLAVTTLDRLVSLQDYSDFARRFAGVGKASAVELSDGFRRIVHVTIAGAGDIPIDMTSDVYRNLRDALHQFGDPFMPLRVDLRDRLALVLSAKVRMAPDYSWVLQEPKIRAALLDAFSFEKRDLVQDALLAETIALIQHMPGVAYVDVDVFDAIAQAQATANFTQQAAAQLALNDRVTARPARIDKQHRILPAQIAYLMPDVPDTLILQELKA